MELFNPITPYPIQRLELEDFSWLFLKSDQSTWPMSHVLNPFLIQVLFQRWYITVIAFYFWESVEVFFLATFSGYELFVGDNSDFEPITDSLLGDQINGLMGLLMGILFSRALGIPKASLWAPNPFSSYKKSPDQLKNTGYSGAFYLFRTVFFRRLAMYALMAIPFSVYNTYTTVTNYSELYPSRKGADVVFRYGLLIVLCMQAVVLVGVRLLYENVESISYELTSPVWRFRKTRKDAMSNLHSLNTFCTFLLVTLMFMHTCAFRFLTYSYFQVWAAWALSMLALFYIFLLSREDNKNTGKKN